MPAVTALLACFEIAAEKNDDLRRYRDQEDLPGVIARITQEVCRDKQRQHKGRDHILEIALPVELFISIKTEL